MVSFIHSSRVDHCLIHLISLPRRCSTISIDYFGTTMLIGAFLLSELQRSTSIFLSSKPLSVIIRSRMAYQTSNRSPVMITAPSSGTWSVSSPVQFHVSSSLLFIHSLNFDTSHKLPLLLTTHLSRFRMPCKNFMTTRMPSCMPALERTTLGEFRSWSYCRALCRAFVFPVQSRNGLLTLRNMRMSKRSKFPLALAIIKTTTAKLHVILIVRRSVSTLISQPT